MTAAGKGLPAAPAATRGLTDPQVLLLAALTWVGAAVARPVPLALGLGLVLLAFAARRPWVLLVGVTLVAGTLGSRAVDGLASAQPARYRGPATLVSDPEDGLGATVADVQVEGKRYELRVRGSGRGALRTRLAGERVLVEGRISPRPPNAPWMEVRHLVGRLDARSVTFDGPGGAPWRAANRVRRALVDGAGSMTPERRSLFTGLVLGDDRDQPATLADDFRGSGLTHLLAVSGENVC